MHGAASVSRRMPESSHFTHRLRGIKGKYGNKERKKMDQSAVEGVMCSSNRKKKQRGVISENIEEETDQKGNLVEELHYFSFSFFSPSAPPTLLHSGPFAGLL